MGFAISGLFQTQAHGRRSTALGSVGSAAAGTEHRHKRFAGVAAHLTIDLDGTESGVARLALCALFAGRSLRTLRTLRPLGTLRTSRPLRTRNALNPLRPLRACRTLRTSVALRAGIPTTSGQRNSDGNNDH